MTTSNGVKIPVIFLFYVDPDLAQFTGGGLTSYIFIRSLARERSFFVKVISTHYLNLENVVQIRIYKGLPHVLNFLIWIIRTIIKIVKLIASNETGIPIIIVGGGPDSPVTLLPLYVLKKVLKKHVCTVSFVQLPVKGTRQRLYAIFLNSLDMIIPSTITVLRSLKKLNIVKPMYITGYGVLKPKTSKHFIEKDIDCIFLGRFTKEKGGYDLIKIARLVGLRKPFVRFVVVGEADKKLMELAKKVGAPIEFAGFVKHYKIWDYLARSKVMVYPSRYDSFAISVAEAMISGLPVITWKISPFKEEFGDSKGVILIEPFNHQAFAEKIIELLDDPLKRKELGAENKEYAVRFRWGSVYKRFKYAVLKALKSCLEELKQGG